MNFRDDASKRSRVEATLELTPLIDVIFLLLIFFVMTTTPAMSAVEQLDVELPDAATGEAIEVDDQQMRVALWVHPDGTVYLREGDDGEEQPVDDVRADLTDLHRRAPGATIWVYGDAQADHGVVMELPDIARQVGFESVHMAVRPGQ